MWRDELLLAHDALDRSERLALADGARSGSLARISRGAYLSNATWCAAGKDERYLWRVRATAARTSAQGVLAGAAAVAVHGLPWWGDWPDVVDMLFENSDRSRTGQVVRGHVLSAVGIDAVIIDGLRVTSLARTAIDVARTAADARSLAIADAVIARGVDPHELAALLLDVPLRQGRAKAARTISLADGRSASAGESLSRYTMTRIGAPAPVLQQSFRHSGGTWQVDFWWHDQRIIGEFDGAMKYLDASLRGGRSVERVVFDEKMREDGLRRSADGFARWGWEVASSPTLLASRLRDAGLRW